MPNTLSNFLIGIGFDFDEDSTKGVDSSIDRVKSNALQMGAVLAGAFGIKGLTADFAEAADRIGKFSEVFGVIPNEVAGLGRALTIEGGSMEGLISQIETIERLRAGVLRGDVGVFARAGISKIDAGIITNAESATEAYIKLGDSFKNLSQQERINAADALGLDAASIRLLSNGSDEVRRLAKEQQTIRPLTEEMTESAARFNKVTANFGNTVGGFADTVSKGLVPAVSDAVEGVTKYLNLNQEIINSNLEGATDIVAKNFETIAISGGLIASSGVLATFGSLASLVPVIGTGLAAIAFGLASITGITAAGFLAYEFWNPEDFEEAFGVELPDALKAEFFRIPLPGDDDNEPNSPSRSSGLVGPVANYSQIRTNNAERRRRLENSVPINLPSTVTPDDAVNLRTPVTRTGAQRRRDRAGGGANSSVPGNGASVVIQNNIILDGQVIDTRIRDVTESVYQESIDDLQTSEGG